ncbi:MAG: hypothetical protein Sv326_1350 (plasmid) [Candidatus Fermentimicrarchaeum limneticum]|uniref:Uncharacterized protein n=1 Tax=Fermentimicrarchaeum limneticum TaxID=2795018 RepID=A0A7D5XD84_FERL1|nr:MAG: hypothetical protein Sv326_1350 [Candidatus Fermentimicrarchaeum limneticum]
MDWHGIAMALLFLIAIARSVSTTNYVIVGGNYYYFSNTVYVSPSGEVKFTSTEVPVVLLLGNGRIPSSNPAIYGSIQMYGLGFLLVGLVYWLPRREEGQEDVLMDEFEEELEFG